MLKAGFESQGSKILLAFQNDVIFCIESDTVALSLTFRNQRSLGALIVDIYICTSLAVREVTTCVLDSVIFRLCFHTPRLSPEGDCCLEEAVLTAELRKPPVASALLSLGKS